MEELELIEVPGYGSVGVVLKINSTTAKKISSVLMQKNTYTIDSSSWAPNWVQEVNEKLKKAKKIEQGPNNKLYNTTELIITTEKEQIKINISTDSKNYIWLFDDE